MTYDSQGRRILHSHPSTWEQECRWQTIRAQQAIDEAKALRARVDELEAVALDYRYVLHSAKTGRDLHCGFYVAKEYHFTRDQIDAALAKISAALQQEAKP
jgi:hypothetical protein